MAARKRILVLGGAGMLGSQVVRHLGSLPGLQVTATVHQTKLRQVKDVDVIDFNATDDSLDLVADYDVVVNCIGLIRQKMRSGCLADDRRAVELNALLPYRIAEACERYGRLGLSVATDCVFSGETGFYDELAPHDPVDIYGRSKSLGEPDVSCYRHLRCSIVGMEQGAAPVSLLGWLLSRPVGDVLKGYTDHAWNGVTTLHFARILAYVISSEVSWTGVQHLVPADHVTKHELLQHFARAFSRDDLKINPFRSGAACNRVLATTNTPLNSALWKGAGYETAPTISCMIDEYADYVAQGGKGHSPA